MPRIIIKTSIRANIHVVFDLARSIDLHKISTSQTNEEAIAGVTTGLIGLGESVTWRARHFGIYQKLTVKIISFDRPLYFVDEMEKGIFKGFKHEHKFEVTNAGTLMIDIFDYKSPLGIFGVIADRVFLKNYMRQLLEKRNKTIKKFAESSQWKEVLNN